MCSHGQQTTALHPTHEKLLSGSHIEHSSLPSFAPLNADAHSVPSTAGGNGGTGQPWTTHLWSL